MAGMRMVITGGTVLGDCGFIDDCPLAIEDGIIQALGAAPGQAPTVDAGGLLVLSGIIDLHADAVERAIEPRPGVAMPLRVALAEHDAWLLAAGITTCFLSLTDGFEPGLRSRDCLRAVLEATATPAPGRVVRTPLHVRREVAAAGSADELVDWLGGGRIGLLSYGDHLPAASDPVQERRMRASLARRLNGHAGDIDAMLDQARERQAAGGITLDRLCAQAVIHGVPVAAHDCATPADADAAARRGATISEFPFDLATALHARQLGQHVLLGAPNVVRGKSHLGLLGAADGVRAGVCNMLCSDYHHHSLFHAPFALAASGTCDLAAAWRLVSAGPAAAAGLSDRGRLAPGQTADLLLVEPGPPPRLRAVWIDGKEAARFP